MFKVPDNLSFHLYELDWDVFSVHMNSATSLCPKLASVGIKSTVCGPESFTPDHKPLLGEDPNVFGTIYYINNELGDMHRDLFKNNPDPERSRIVAVRS